MAGGEAQAERWYADEVEVSAMGARRTRLRALQLYLAMLNRRLRRQQSRQRDQPSGIISPGQGHLSGLAAGDLQAAVSAWQP